MATQSTTGPLTIYKPDAGDNVKTHETGTGASGYNRANLDNLNAAFNASTGHDHDGTDSKKIASTNLSDTPFNASTGHDHDGTDSKAIADVTAAAAHVAASAAVHGLPASVNVLGDRTASGRYIQHAAVPQQTTGGGDQAIYSTSVAVTFPVAFGAAPVVAMGGYIENIGGWAFAIQVTTTGFTAAIYSTPSSGQAVTTSYMALGGS